MGEHERKEFDELDPANQSLAEALNLSFNILKIIMGLLVLLFLFSGVFTVDQDEVAMVLRFGKIQGTMANRILKPGLHWTWPYPLSEVIKIPTGRQHQLVIDDFWYYEKDRANLDKRREKVPETLDPEIDGYCLTGDANIIHCQWQVRYRIADPYAYYTRGSQPQELLKYIVSSCIVKAAATFTAHNALRDRIDDFRLQVQSQSQQQLDLIECGIKIQGLAIPQLRAPRQVQHAFEAVLQAKNEMEKNIESAKNYRSQILNKAQGERARLIAAAKNYALQTEKEAQSDATYFAHLVDLYRRHSAILKHQHYGRVIEEVTHKIQEMFLFAKKSKKYRELRVQFNRDPNLYRIAAPKEE